jgi:hypothetical protein
VTPSQAVRLSRYDVTLAVETGNAVANEQADCLGSAILVGALAAAAS